jgi:hypothetical protein
METRAEAEGPGGWSIVRAALEGLYRGGSMPGRRRGGAGKTRAGTYWWVMGLEVVGRCALAVPGGGSPLSTKWISGL